MNWKYNIKSEEGRAGLCAGAGILVHTAAFCSWQVSAVVAAIMSVLLLWSKPRRVPKGVTVARELWNTLAAVSVLHWLKLYWPGFPAGPVVITAVVFALWAAGADKSSFRGWAAAAFPVTVMILCVLVSALSDINMYELREMASSDGLALCAFGMILAFRLGCGFAGSALVPATSAVVRGVLGGFVGTGFYELSRSIRFLGAIPRFESLSAVAVTLSFLSALSMLLNSTREIAPRNWMMAMKAAWCLSLWYIGASVNPAWLALTGFILWMIPGVLGSRIGWQEENGKKMEKTVDK